MSKLETENKILRRLLWLRHGCPSNALYGDDGEMQCHKCCLDFKRDSAQKIDEKFTAIGMKKYIKHMKELDKKEGK